ncbi:unnamed protein product [Macrosiphum euphorbiae]|uniref:Endonuclease/exonuclease/phosphatase domain-containing protein n=1 Tax=Macrosiphum euphorbiae TaxID=13131 RepID=A0AAV0Y9P7_9HEMI|nr:unnamed protein product [Macrosiphum euphorbiae]
MSTHIKIYQHNVNRDRIASHQLREACKVNKIDYLLIQEPLVISGKVYAFESCRSHISKSNGAAIIAFTNRYQALKLSNFSSSHIVAIKVAYGSGNYEHVVLASAYFKYSLPTTAHVEQLEHIIAKEKRTVICADTNGHSDLWLSNKRNRRGKIVEQFIRKHGLIVHNCPGTINTFCRRDGRTSNIDVTMSTANTASLVKDWTVIDLTDSDHRVISFKLAVKKPVERVPAEIRYDVRSADWDLFKTSLLGEIGRIPDSSISITTTADGIIRAITMAADRSIPKKRQTAITGRSP